MKTNEAPEKIYLEKIYPDNGVLPNGLNYNQSLDNIEYTRTDTFIEKACDWLEPVFKNYAGYNCGMNLVKDFRKAMEE